MKSSKTVSPFNEEEKFSRPTQTQPIGIENPPISSSPIPIPQSFYNETFNDENSSSSPINLGLSIFSISSEMLNDAYTSPPSDH